MDALDNHDNMLFEMLKECKSLPVFLDQIFGFLNRRSDFYHIVTDSKSPIGLPPGLAEQITKQTFYKWKPKTQTAPQPTINKVDIESTTQSTGLPPKFPQKEPLKKVGTAEPTFTSSECYNGAVYETYSWSQSLLEVDVNIKIPPNTVSKEIKVDILPSKLCVKLKGTVLLEGDLCDKCKHNDAIWSLHKNQLEIHLDKVREIWWDCLIKNEPKLDISKLDCSRPYEDLSEEAQAKIEELQWNQERKRLGLPTSDELNTESMLKKSWNAGGSPFSGPFDPKSVNFS